MCPLGLTFFGLTSDTAPLVRKNLFSHIHQIIFHGKGGYDYYTVYNMPVWLRKFTFSEIDKFYQEEKSAIENAKDGGSKSSTLINSDGKVNTPAFMKASKDYKGKTSYK